MKISKIIKIKMIPARKEIKWIITVMRHLMAMITNMKDKEIQTSQTLFSKIQLNEKINKRILGSKAPILLNTLKIILNYGTKLKEF